MRRKAPNLQHPPIAEVCDDAGLITLQEDSFHWILNFAILQIQNSLNLNPTNDMKCGFPNASIYKRIYKTKIHECEFFSFGLGR